MNHLKEAEKNATKMIQDERKGEDCTFFCPSVIVTDDSLARIDRMKEAKVEAEQAVASYRAEMESVYQDSLRKV